MPEVDRVRKLDQNLMDLLGRVPSVDQVLADELVGKAHRARHLTGHDSSLLAFGRRGRRARLA
jgi:hypothetical protein